MAIAIPAPRRLRFCGGLSVPAASSTVSSDLTSACRCASARRWFSRSSSASSNARRRSSAARCFWRCLAKSRSVFAFSAFARAKFFSSTSCAANSLPGTVNCLRHTGQLSSWPTSFKGERRRSPQCGQTYLTECAPNQPFANSHGNGVCTTALDDRGNALAAANESIANGAAGKHPEGFLRWSRWARMPGLFWIYPRAYFATVPENARTMPLPLLLGLHCHQRCQDSV